MANPKRPPSREVRRLREELRRLMERWDTVIRRGTELERDLARGLAQLRESRAAETLREIPVEGFAETREISVAVRRGRSDYAPLERFLDFCQEQSAQF